MKQLPQLESGSQWTIETAPVYLAQQEQDPWADYWLSTQTLTAAMKALGYRQERSSSLER